MFRTKKAPRDEAALHLKTLGEVDEVPPSPAIEPQVHIAEADHWVTGRVEAKIDLPQCEPSKTSRCAEDEKETDAGTPADGSKHSAR